MFYGKIRYFLKTFNFISRAFKCAFVNFPYRLFVVNRVNYVFFQSGVSFLPFAGGYIFFRFTRRIKTESAVSGVIAAFLYCAIKQKNVRGGSCFCK